jgi:hypothetical protein
LSQFTSIRNFDLTQRAGTGTPSYLQFSRNVETMSPVGERVAANVPRYGRRISIAGAPGPVETIANIVSGDTTSNAAIAVGRDIDGTTLVFNRLLSGDNSTGTIKVVRINEQTGQETLLTNLSYVRATGSRGPDLRRIAGTANDDGFLYQLIRAQIVHGTIVAFCRIVERTGGTATNWTGDETIGCAFAVSNDYGQTWQYTIDDRLTPTNKGKARGNMWSFQSYWCPRRTIGQPLTEVWLCAQDYFNNPGSGEGANVEPDGGTSYWFRMTRPDAASRFVPDQTGTPNQIKWGRFSKAAATLFAWESGRSYAIGDRVASVGRGYERRTNGSGTTAPLSDPTNWRDIGPSGNGITRPPAWSAATNYIVGDLVSRPNGKVYACFVAHSANATPPESDAPATIGTRWQNIGPQNCQPQGVGMVLRDDGKIALLQHESDIGYSSITEVRFQPDSYDDFEVSYNRDGVQDSGVFTNGVLTSTGVAGRIRGTQFQGSNWVGMAPHVETNKLILGPDAVNSFLCEYIVGTSATNYVPRIARVAGGVRNARSGISGAVSGVDVNLANWGSQGTLTLVIQADRPEGDASGNFDILGEWSANQQLNSRNVTGIDQAVISRDGGRTWAFCGFTREPFSLGSNIANGFIYYRRQSDNRIVRQRLPDVRSARLLNVSCGGVNRANDGLADSAFSIASLAGRNGIAFASSGQRKIGGNLQRFKIANDSASGSVGQSVGDFSPPPFWHDSSNQNSPRVMAIFFGLTQGTSLSSTGLVRCSFASNSLVGANQYSTNFALTATHVRVRCWAAHRHGLSESWIRSATGGNMGDAATGNSPLFLRSESGPPYDNRPSGAITVPTSNEWFPITFADLIQRNSPNTNDGWMLADSTLANLKYPQDLYFTGCTEVIEGQGAFPYSLQRSATIGGTFTGPDEIATVTGLGLTGAWTTAWAMAVSPAGFGWDQFGPPRNGAAPDWCIGTLWADANNWIELRPSPFITMSGSTVTRESRFSLRIRANGTTIDVTDFALGVSFEAEQSVQFAMSLDRAAGELRIALQCGGQTVHTRTIGAATSPAITGAMMTALAAANFNEFRCSNNDRTVVDGMQYGGGTCRIGDSSTINELADIVRSVSWTGELVASRASRVPQVSPLLLV